MRTFLERGPCALRSPTKNEAVRVRAPILREFSDQRRERVISPTVASGVSFKSYLIS